MGDADDSLSLVGPALARAGYDVHAQIGHGAFGRVYRATRLSANEVVAIKVLDGLPQLAPERLKGLVREVNSLRSIQHPHIVELRDAGSIDDEAAWYAMEHLPVDLESLVKSSGPLAIAEACRIVLQVLQALDAMHRLDPPQGPLVHRDVKPSNILIADPAGERIAKLADFGMAKNFEQAGLSRISSTGVARGTLYYMSPEQLVDSKYIGPECDLFSAGAVLYFALTGQVMYHSPHGLNELVQWVGDRRIVPLTTRAPDTPAELVEIFRRAVGLDSLRRFRTANQFHTHLQEFLRHR